MERINALLWLIAIVIAVYSGYGLKGLFNDLCNPLNMDEYEKKHGLPRHP